MRKVIKNIRIQLIKNYFSKKIKDIIERITYREVYSKIIIFFSLYKSKQIKEEYEKKSY